MTLLPKDNSHNSVEKGIIVIYLNVSDSRHISKSILQKRNIYLKSKLEFSNAVRWF